MTENERREDRNIFKVLVASYVVLGIIGALVLYL